MSRDLHPLVQREKYYQPEKWTGSHRRIVALEQAGYKPGEIAKLVGDTPSHVSIILNDPRADLERQMFGERVIQGVTDIRVKLALYSGEALEEIVDEMRNEPKAEIRQRAAFGILDRAGFGPKTSDAPVRGDSVPTEVLGRMQEVMEEMRNARVADYTLVEPKEAVDG